MSRWDDVLEIALLLLAVGLIVLGVAEWESWQGIIILGWTRVCGGCASWILPGDPWDQDAGRCVDCPRDAE